MSIWRSVLLPSAIIVGVGFIATSTVVLANPIVPGIGGTLFLANDDGTYPALMVSTLERRRVPRWRRI